MRRHPMTLPLEVGAIDDRGADDRVGTGSLPSRHRLALATLALAALLSIVVVGGASAATVYRTDDSTFDRRPNFSAPLASGAAVENSTGRFFVANFNQPQSIEIYAPEEGSAKRIGTLGEGVLGSPNFVAIDQSDGSVYVADSRLGQIVKFEKTGAEPPTYARDAGFVSPEAGSGPGQIGNFESPIAVDPSTGDLLVADRGDDRVSRFTAAGSFVSSFDGSGAPAGPFHSLSSLAISNSGAIYVVDIVEGNINYEYEHGRSVVERFAADGTADPSFQPDVPTPRSVVYDDAAANLVVTGRSDKGPVSVHPEPLGLFVIHGGEVIDETDFPAGSGGGVSTGLAIAPSGPYRLYATTADGGNGGYYGVTVFEARHAPDVTLEAATDVRPTSATFAGTVNPLGRPTNYHLEYSREGGAPLTTAETSVGEGETAVAVSEELTGLIANSEYSVRLVATDGQTSIASRPRTFQTPPAPPAVVTGAPGVAATSASLVGIVNPYGQQTTYYFECGTPGAYGTRVPVDRGALAGNGRAPLRVTQELTGLQSMGTYHCRLAATNASGTSYGEDVTFTTTSVLSRRAYELVTPNEKGGSFVYNKWVQATPDGDEVSYVMQNVIPGLGGAAPKLPQYSSTRSTEGWATVGLEPHNARSGFRGTLLQDVLAVSEDGTRAVVLSSAALAPGGKEGGSNIYLFDIADGTYETILGNPDPRGFSIWAGLQSFGPEVFLGGSPDFSRVYLGNGAAFDFEMVKGVAAPSIFEWSENGGLRVLAEKAVVRGFIELGEPHIVSDDGSVIFYQASEGRSLHALSDGQDVAVSNETGEFVGAAANGEAAFYIENSRLFRFETKSGKRTLIAENVGAETAWGVSPTADTVYFTSVGTETMEAGVWVWHDGDLHRLGSDYSKPTDRMASPNGRYALFSSPYPLTGYDSGGVNELFWYDADTQELACASCRTDGGKALGQPLIGEPVLVFGRYKPRAILDDGEAFFDTPDPLLPSDVNSSRDVYSFDGHRQSLVSSGAGNSDSYFGDASTDGSNVFFLTGDRLVKGDTNDDVDLYDARMGGGIPSQNRDPEGPACSGPGCRIGAASPSGPAVTTETAAAQKRPARKHPHHKRQCHRRKHGGAKRCARHHASKHRRQAR